MSNTRSPPNRLFALGLCTFSFFRGIQTRHCDKLEWRAETICRDSDSSSPHPRSASGSSAGPPLNRYPSRLCAFQARVKPAHSCRPIHDDDVDQHEGPVTRLISSHSKLHRSFSFVGLHLLSITISSSIYLFTCTNRALEKLPKLHINEIRSN